NLVIQIGHINVRLTTGGIPALPCQTPVIGLLVVSMPEGTHLAVVVVYQSLWLMRDTLGAEHPVVQEVDAVLAGDGAPARQSGAHFLAPFEQLVRDEPLVLALIPLFTPTGGL